MKDIIIHETNHVFSFKDRIRILFGKKLTVHSEIETEHEEVLLTGNVQCKTNVIKFFRIKSSKLIGAGLIDISKPTEDENSR